MPGCEKALRHLSLLGERPLAPREEFPAAGNGRGDRIINCQ